MALRFALYDLDDTLYPLESGVMDQIRALMNRYLCDKLSLSPEEASQLRRRYYQAYGTTFAGLRQEYAELDPEEFLVYVHDLPVSDYLSANQALREVLLALPLRRVVFTNGTVAHAERVLAALDLSDCFERVIDVTQCDYVSKPAVAAYHSLLAALKATGDECVLIEDSVRNLEPAKALGMTTVLVQSHAAGSWPWVDYHVETVLETGPLIARLIEEKPSLPTLFPEGEERLP